MDVLVRIDSFLMTFITMMCDKELRTQEEMYKLFGYVQYMDEEVYTDSPLITAWQNLTFEREYEGIWGLISRNADDLKTPQSDFERILRSIPSNDAKMLFVLLFSVYGERILRARGLLSRVAALHAFNAVSFTYGANFTMRTVKELPYGAYVHEHLAKMLGRINVEELTKYRRSSYSFDIVGNVYGIDKVLPPDNLVLACMPVDDSIRTRVYRHIISTRDVAYAPILHAMCLLEDTAGKAAYYMAKSLGGEFTPLKRPADHRADLDVLWRWFHGEATDAELDAKFDDVLGAYENMFKYMTKCSMGIGIAGKIRITAKRYMKILRLAKGQDRTRGLVGPFIIRDSPFIGIKLTRRDYDNGRTKK
jgi:hypothetical protein